MAVVIVPVPAIAAIKRQHRIVAAFRAAGAIDREHATTLAALGFDEGMAFRQLRKNAAVREAGENRYYLDEAAWKAHESTRLRIGLTIMGVALLALTAVIVWVVMTR